MQQALDLAERQHGLVHRSQLLAAGLSPSDIRLLLRRRGWETLGRSTYRRTGSQRSHFQDVLADVYRIGPEAALFGSTAVWLWLYDSTAPIRPVHVVQRAGLSTRGLPGVVVHRMNDLPQSWTVLHRGVPVVRPALAAVHLFSQRRFESAERQVDRLWSQRLLSGASIVRCLDELGERGRNGIGGLRRYLEPRGQGWTPPASGLESRVIQVLASAGIQTRRQVDLGNDGEWTGRVDLMCVGTNVVVEVQSELHHSSLTDVAADARRIAQLSADGFVVVEVTDTEAFRTPWIVVQRVGDALRHSHL